MNWKVPDEMSMHATMFDNSVKKNLLLYAHYYYPDVASTGQILTELAEGMKDTFNITVICVVPSYTGVIEDKYKTVKYHRENINGINIIRIRVPEFSKTNKMSRIKNICSYFVNAILVTFKVGKMNYIYAISQPPILGGVLGVVGKWIKRGKLIYNIQDFNPEQIMAVGYSKSKLVLAFAMWLDKLSCRNADKVIVVGRDMIEILKGRFNNKKVPNHVFINNWINEKEIYPLDASHPKVVEFKKKYKLEDKFIIEYSGNLGLYYDLPNIMKVIKRFRDRNDVVFAFIGDGSVKVKLEDHKKKNHMDNVLFIPYQQKKDLMYSLNAGDVHWVVNARSIKGVSVPSKLYGIMAVGKPVLGVLDKGSEARLLIEEAGCGWCCETGNYDCMERLISEMIEKKTQIRDMGVRGREYLEKHLTKDVSVQKYINVIKSI